MMDHAFRLAMQWFEEGLAVIPLKPDLKDPLIRWKNYQMLGIPRWRLESLYRANPNAGVGIVCGLPSDNLIVLDFDSHAGFHRACADSPKLTALLDLTLVVTTYRGVHVYLRTPVLVASMKVELYRLEVRSQGQYVVAPGTIVKGHCYTILRPFESIFRLSALDDLGLFQLTPYRMPIVSPPSASSRDREILAGQVGSFSSRSEAEMSIAVKMVKDGYDGATIEAFFERNARPGGKYHEKSARQRHVYLQLTIRNAIKYVGENRRDLDVFVDAAERVIVSFAFPQRTALVDCNVAMAILRIVRRTGKTSGLHLSTREIALEATVSRNAASAALRRSPVITRTRYATSHRPHEYRLSDKFVHTVTCFVEGMGEFVGVQVDQYHTELQSLDLFRTAGLGRLAGAIYRLLERSAINLSKAEIATRCAASERSVERAVKRLLKHGLLESRRENRRMGYRAVPLSPEQIIDLEISLGVHGHTARERCGFERERQRWLDHITTPRSIHQPNETTTTDNSSLY